MSNLRSGVVKNVLLLMCFTFVLGIVHEALAQEEGGKVSSDENVPVIKPWKIIVQDKDYNGAWIVSGDLTGDGKPELVYTRSLMEGGDHYTASALACTLDNKTLWKWGDPKGQRESLGSDVACQIYDWDNDGKNEVILSTKQEGKTWLIELDGTTGKEKRRFEIPDNSADCITFCNLTGPPHSHPKDVLVKTRYTQVWAYDYDGNQLWTVHMPGGYKTAHQARPMDIDKDGIDEILVGFAMVDAKGKQLWIANREGKTYDGHLDCGRLFKLGSTPEKTRIALTYCGGNRMAMVDGLGNILWDLTDGHYESIDVGKVRSDVPGNQIVVDIPYAPAGKKPICVLDENGKLLTKILMKESRIHRLINWFGGELESILIAEDDVLYDGYGKKQAIFDTPIPEDVELPEGKNEGNTCFTGDMTGDGIPDVVIYTNPGKLIYIYKNEKGKKPEGGSPIGTKVNFTLY